MTTSVVVVSYRPGDWLGPCVASAVAAADQVVVVDNGSGGVAGAVAGGLGATVVTSRTNLGFAGGVALGLRSVTGDVVGVLNDDAVAGPGWLTSAAAVLADPSVGAVTPKVVLAGTWAEVVLDDPVWWAPGDARPLGRRITSVTVDGEERLGRLLGAGIHDPERDGTGQWRWSAGPVPFYVPLGGDDAATPVDQTVLIDGLAVVPRARVALLNHAGSHLHAHGVAGEIGLGAPDDGRFDTPGEVFGFSGTAPVFRTEVLRRIGAFAPRFFAYNEDTDWCLRAHLHGLRVLYDPSATVTHRLSATSGGAAASAVRLLARRNALLCLVRTAPAGVAAHHQRARAAQGRGDGIRRDVARLLPWAVTTRVSMQRHWTRRPEEVWSRWVGAGADWDRSPARPR